MTLEQLTVFGIIAITMGCFLWGKVRYDIIAIMALLAGVYGGVVPPDAAFQGFAHPAVITVAAVLIISRTLQNSGLVDYLVRFLAPTRRTTTLQVAAGSALGAFLSCFMNNVGALALMLPVTLRNALKKLADAEDFAAVGIDAGQRPEQIAIADFVALSNHLCRKS